MTQERGEAKANGTMVNTASTDKNDHDARKAALQPSMSMSVFRMCLSTRPATDGTLPDLGMATASPLTAN